NIRYTASLPIILFSLSVITEQISGDIFILVLLAGVSISGYTLPRRVIPLWASGWLGMTAILPFFLAIYDYHVYGGMVYPLIASGIILSFYITYRLYTESNRHLFIGMIAALLVISTRIVVLTSFDIGLMIVGIVVALLAAHTPFIKLYIETLIFDSTPTKNS
ncbi:MAG: hypothetical protein ACPG7F_16390, partial [Aggregatilineales bacterium]